MTALEDTAFLIVNSGDLAMALGSLLLSIPPLRHVERVPDSATLLKQLTPAAQPALVVLDTAKLGPATPALVQTVQQIAPDTRYIVLSDSVAEARELVSSGIDSVAVKGGDARGLVDTIESLLGEYDTA